MSFYSPLRAVGVSIAALSVTATTGLALASVPTADTVTLATPASTASAADATPLERTFPISSRDAERDALASELSLAAQYRTDALTTTQDAISATDQALQAQRAAEEAKRAAEATRVAAEKAAADELAREQGYAPGTTAPKEIARQIAKNVYGWGDGEFTCYDNIIMRESNWIVTADNPTSSAYGIPQALPGKRMASEGADWRTNPATQIRWGLKYVKERYGSPCRAWSFKRANGWY